MHPSVEGRLGTPKPGSLSLFTYTSEAELFPPGLWSELQSAWASTRHDFGLTADPLQSLTAAQMVTADDINKDLQKQGWWQTVVVSARSKNWEGSAPLRLRKLKALALLGLLLTSRL